jgi:hypothetical protein
MRFWKWTIGVMIAVLVVGCATYPVGYWVDPKLDEQSFENDPKYFDDQRFENSLLYCNQWAHKNADVIVPTNRSEGGGGGQANAIIGLILLPWLIGNEQRWANVYTNTIKGCMEDGGYRWANDPKGRKIGYMKAKRFAPSQ